MKPWAKASPHVCASLAHFRALRRSGLQEAWTDVSPKMGALMSSETLSSHLLCKGTL